MAMESVSPEAVFTLTVETALRVDADSFVVARKRIQTLVYVYTHTHTHTHTHTSYSSQSILMYAHCTYTLCCVHFINHTESMTRTCSTCKFTLTPTRTHNNNNNNNNNTKFI